MLRERLLKPLGRFLARHRRLGPLTAPLFHGLVAVQIAACRLAEPLRRRPAADDPLLDQLTLVIKAFERPQSLSKLLRSIRRMYPRIAIVVVDDSRDARPLPGVETVLLPFDSGVSAGRNAGLARVRTPYAMILDDDFLFYRGTDLAAALHKLAAEPAIDILGGYVITLPAVEWNDSDNTPIYKPGLGPPGERVGGLERRRKVPNFYLARRERLALVGWDAALKRLDHIDFFTRADGVLCTVFDPALRCLHVKSLFDRHYLGYRIDYRDDLALLAARYPGVPLREDPRALPPAAGPWRPAPPPDAAR